MSSNLIKEIESRKGFAYTLREENRILFHRILGECKPFQDINSTQIVRKEVVVKYVDEQKGNFKRLKRIRKHHIGRQRLVDNPKRE